VARQIQSFVGKEPVLVSDIRRRVAKRDRAPYFQDALQSLLDAGLLVQEDNRVRQA
jgi:hypothetical protein